MQELQLRVLPFRKGQPGVAFRACWRTAARPRAAYMPSQVMGACSQEGLPPGTGYLPCPVQSIKRAASACQQHNELQN